MPRRRVYPISPSFKDMLTTVDALGTAIKLHRALKNRLKAGDTEIEILVFIGSFEDPVPLSEILKNIKHVAPRRISDLISLMSRDRFIIESNHEDIEEPSYTLSANAAIKIRNVTNI